MAIAWAQRRLIIRGLLVRRRAPDGLPIAPQQLGVPTGQREHAAGVRVWVEVFCPLCAWWSRCERVILLRLLQQCQHTRRGVVPRETAGARLKIEVDLRATVAVWLEIAARGEARKAMWRKEDQGAICDIDTAFL